MKLGLISIIFQIFFGTFALTTVKAALPTLEPKTMLSVCNQCSSTALKSYAISLHGLYVEGRMPLDVHLLDPSNRAVTRFVVTVSTSGAKSASERTPNALVKSDLLRVFDGMRAIALKINDGLSSEELPWGNFASTGVHSAHTLVTSPSAVQTLRLGIREYFENESALQNVNSLGEALLAVAKRVMDITMTQQINITFPDGTSVVVRIVSLDQDVVTGESSVNVEVDLATAKDGSAQIPVDASGMGRVAWTQLTNDQTQRFLDTARLMGIPITGGGGSPRRCFVEHGTNESGVPTMYIRCTT